MQTDYSIRACKLCRQRRVKCDKTLPACKRCETSGRTCPGYPHQRVFVDQTMRYGPGSHPLAYHDNFVPVPGTSGLSLSSLSSTPHLGYGSPNSNVTGFQEFHTPIGGGLATQVPSVHYGSPLLPDHATIPLQQHTALPADGLTDQDWEFFDLDIDTYYANGNNACGFFTDIGELDPTTFINSPGDSAIETVNSNSVTTSEPKDGMLIPQEEFAPMMRLFVEILAPWMDMFDIDAYFSRTLPYHAALDVLLQFALAAVAAKQAARYLVTQRAASSAKVLDQIMASYSERRPTEWFFKAARYYDQGISGLRDVLTRLPEGSMSALLGSRMHEAYNIERDPVQNVLSAISIFSFYESLDDCFTKPSKHLIGFLALLNDSSSPAESPRYETQLLLSSRSAGRAAFWYLARKEMFAAYNNHTYPAIDPDVSLPWIEAGLPQVIFAGLDMTTKQSPVISTTYSKNLDPMTMVNALIWLTTKVVKLVAESSNFDSPQPNQIRNTNNTSLTSDQARKWIMLRDYLQNWYRYRPQLLQAYAISEVGLSRHGGTINKTISFTSSVAVAVMQMYHFAQILLLLNRPEGRSHAQSQSMRLYALKQNADEVEVHSREICAIAFCIPASNLQRQMSHPLQLAGVCFHNAEDRIAITKILEDAASETCSAPEEMLQSLLLQWNLHDGVQPF